MGPCSGSGRVESAQRPRADVQGEGCSVRGRRQGMQSASHSPSKPQGQRPGVTATVNLQQNRGNIRRVDWVVLVNKTAKWPLGPPMGQFAQRGLFCKGLSLCESHCRGLDEMSAASVSPQILDESGLMAWAMSRSCICRARKPKQSESKRWCRCNRADRHSRAGCPPLPSGEQRGSDASRRGCPPAVLLC
jgi:hypothetical protein